MTSIGTDSVKLLIKLPGQASRMIELKNDTFTIGRKSDNDLPIDDHTVSGHHARIVRIQSVYFVEDLKSTNGTSLNGKTVERAQLRDADVITIGRHRIIFQDGTAETVSASRESADPDQTTAVSRASLAARQSFVTAKLLVTAGKTERAEYHLTDSINLIGAKEGAVVRLTGWFAPKSAAVITARNGAYMICPTPGGKRLLVNEKAVLGRQLLKNGDTISVGGASMVFYLLPQKGN